jgi:hypothetical protein
MYKQETSWCSGCSICTEWWQCWWLIGWRTELERWRHRSTSGRRRAESEAQRRQCGGSSGQSGGDAEARRVRAVMIWRCARLGRQLDGSELIYLDNRSGFREWQTRGLVVLARSESWLASPRDGSHPRCWIVVPYIYTHDIHHLDQATGQPTESTARPT